MITLLQLLYFSQDFLLFGRHIIDFVNEEVSKSLLTSMWILFFLSFTNIDLQFCMPSVAKMGRKSSGSGQEWHSQFS